ncbi:MAG: hypothetical protein EHM58_13365 [Ignavibacteriae bacterium]|nr:MAG: hypothetical protein EHM58_13365 [Ignavibacteriota bacterium]
MDKEVVINKQKLKLTNLDKLYWPDEKITKGDLIEYYREVSKYILPYLKDRPQSLNRYPNGIKGKNFFQKDVGNMPPDWVSTYKILSESTNKKVNYIVCRNEATLLYMVNLGCIEINPWSSRIQSLETPDYLAIDLDPEGISFDSVVETALAVKEVLDEAEISSYCKTSGKTGMHIFIPLKAKYNFEITKEFAHIIAKITHDKVPGITSLERSPSKRKKKVYIDFLQNNIGQTLAAPYSVRPSPGAAVSTPLLWKEVKRGLDPHDFNIKNTSKRISKIGDIFYDVLRKGTDIEKKLKKLDYA